MATPRPWSGQTGDSQIEHWALRPHPLHTAWPGLAHGLSDAKETIISSMVVSLAGRDICLNSCV